jgi:hypothetical protein
MNKDPPGKSLLVFWPLNETAASSHATAAATSLVKVPMWTVSPLCEGVSVARCGIDCNVLIYYGTAPLNGMIYGPSIDKKLLRQHFSYCL